jgi:hypothetical protein
MASGACRRRRGFLACALLPLARTLPGAGAACRWLSLAAGGRRLTLPVAAMIPLAGAAAPAPWRDTDVPYVQSPDNVVDAMLELAAVGKGDVLIDLGSGDGRIVIAAARRYGIRGVGIEIDPRLVELSRANAERAGVAALTEFRVQDLFVTDISAATVVTMYLLPEVNTMLRPRLLETLRPGSRVVSHDWDMGDWQPDRAIEVAAPDKKIGLAKTSRLMLWVIPASVGGRWSWTQTSDRNGRQEVQVLMNLEQAYQRLHGEVIVGTVRFPLRSARLRGRQLEVCTELPLGALNRGWTFRGAVDGDRLEGEAQPDGGERVKWAASRVARPPEPRSDAGHTR